MALSFEYLSDRWHFVVEDFHGHSLVHAICKKPGPSALKEGLAFWKSYRSQHHQTHYAINSSPGDQRLWRHFVTLFGFKPTGLTVPLANGIERELFVHESDFSGPDPAFSDADAGPLVS